jgi:hypothetical protein
MAADEFVILLDLYQAIEQKFSKVTRQQQDLTEKLDLKIKETEMLSIELKDQSLPLSITWR